MNDTWTPRMLFPDWKIPDIIYSEPNTLKSSVELTLIDEVNNSS